MQRNARFKFVLIEFITEDTSLIKSKFCLNVYNIYIFNRSLYNLVNTSTVLYSYLQDFSIFSLNCNTILQSKQPELLYSSRAFFILFEYLPLIKPGFDSIIKTIEFKDVVIPIFRA